MILRKLQITVLLLPLVSGSLYAGESVLFPRIHRAPVAVPEQSFEALQFEIDFFDRALNRVGLEKKANSRSSNALLYAPGLTESTAENASDFWRRIESLRRQKLEFLEMEHQILTRAFPEHPGQRGELHSTSPLRHLHGARAGGERCAAASGGSLCIARTDATQRLSPRDMFRGTARVGVGRFVDVRASLHLHAIRNGYISAETDTTSLLRVPARTSFFSAFSSPVTSALTSSVSSALSPASAIFNFDSDQPMPTTGVGRPSRTELIGVSL